MAKRNWKESVFSDGTGRFLTIKDKQIRTRIRVFRESPVEAVWVRLIRNGATVFIPAEKKGETGSFAIWEAAFEITQTKMQYQFCLKADGRLYYYNQEGLKDNATDRIHDFVVPVDYQAPSWISHSVFYQIFPDRFCNGNPDNDVRDGEYLVNGYETMKIKDWNTPAGTYDQCHCADFYGGDLEGIRQKIPYLKNLGITALYLNPIFLAPSVHKYDCIDYLKVDPHFGGEEALQKLSEELHANGMRLILDISINHTGTAHRWFNKDAVYFDPSVGAYHNPKAEEREFYVIHDDGSYECWDGEPSLPKLNFRSEALRDMLYRGEGSVLKKWLKPPYSIDGWRFDVADVMANFNEAQLASEVWPQIRRALREENPDCYILAENWEDCTEFLQGDCWDAPMNYYGFGRILRQFYGCPDPSLERDDMLWPSSVGLSAEGFCERVISYLSRLPYPLWKNQYNLFDSHDIGRFHCYPGMNEKKYRGAVLALFTMIGVPSVYYGDEAGIGGDVGFFEGARYPMPWERNFESEELFLLHQKLATLRKESEVLAEGSFRFLYAKDRVLAFARFDEEEAYVTILSADEEERNVELDLSILGSVRHEKITRSVGSADLLAKNDGTVRLSLDAFDSCLIHAVFEN